MKNQPDIRWIQRFQNFDRAFILLRSAIEEFDPVKTSMLEQEGTIQRFEYTYELAWKTLKDYLQENGNTILPEVTARAVFKEAFSAGIIRDGQVFFDMMMSRNLLSHTYDFAKFKEVLSQIKRSYLPALSDLHELLMNRVIEANSK